MFYLYQKIASPTIWILYWAILQFWLYFDLLFSNTRLCVGAGKHLKQQWCTVLCFMVVQFYGPLWFFRHTSKHFIVTGLPMAMDNRTAKCLTAAGVCVAAFVHTTAMATFKWSWGAFQLCSWWPKLDIFHRASGFPVCDDRSGCFEIYFGTFPAMFIIETNNAVKILYTHFLLWRSVKCCYRKTWH